MNKVPSPLNLAAQGHAKNSAIISGNKVISYAAYEHMVTATALRLQEIGIDKTERVAIVSHNCWQYPILLFALVQLGAVACPINPRFPREYITLLLNEIASTTVVDPLDKSAHVKPARWRKIDFDTIDTAQKPRTHQANAHATDIHRPATIIFSSGTSAKPKAVLHSFGNHYYSALGSNKNISVQPGDRWLCSLPLYHVGGLGILFRTLLGGAAVVVPPHKEPITKSIERYNVTHLSLVGTQLRRLLDAGLSPQMTKKIKAVLIGGGNIPSSLLTRAYEGGLPVHPTYGLTEMASQVTTTAPQEPRDRLNTCGRVLDYRKLKVSNREILVKGKTLFKGYVDSKTTTLPLDDEGWFQTGDLGHVDANGYLEFRGRKDNMFISGGENIHPEEIENVLNLIPDTLDALVVPVEDEEFGFRPAAFIRTLQGRQIDEKNIVSFLERNLPRFKIPVNFFNWPDDVTKGRLKPHRAYFAKEAQKLRGHAHKLCRTGKRSKGH